MKKFIILTGVLLLFVNLVTYLVLEFYGTDSMISSQISILISVGILYYVATSNLPDGFKIGLKYGLKLTGLGRFVLALFISIPLTNSLFFLAFIIIFFIEVFAIASMRFVSKYTN